MRRETLFGVSTERRLVVATRPCRCCCPTGATEHGHHPYSQRVAFLGTTLVPVRG